MPGGSDYWGGAKATGVSEKGLDLGYVLKMEMPGFAEGLQVV